jgi:hypothetical protein
MSSFRLLGPSKDGKVLVVDESGKLWYDEPKDGVDADWTFIDCSPHLNGEQSSSSEEKEPKCIVSKNLKMVIEYENSGDEQISAKKFIHADKHTHWYVSQDNEFYCLSNEGEDEPTKKYMWSALDKLFITSDDFLAEQFKAISKEGHDFLFSPKKTSQGVWLLIAFFILGFMIWWWFSKK